MKTKRKPLKESAGQGIQNRVHQLIEFIEAYYHREGGKKKDFTNAALTGVLEFIDEIVATESISSQTKIELLAKICETGNKKIEELSAEVKSERRELWSDRGSARRQMSPCDFVKENYSTYGKGLILSDVRDSDLSLYRALIYYKKEHGWPEDFTLQTKRQKNDQTLIELGYDVRLDSLDDLSPKARRNRRRLQSAQHYRKRKISS